MTLYLSFQQQTYNVRVEDDGKVYVNYASSELSLQDLSEPLFPDEAPQGIYGSLCMPLYSTGRVKSMPLNAALA